MANSNPNETTRFKKGNKEGAKNKGKKRFRTMLKEQLILLVEQLENSNNGLKSANSKLEKTNKLLKKRAGELGIDISEIKSPGDFDSLLFQNLAIGLQLGPNSKKPEDQKYSSNLAANLLEYKFAKKKQIETTGEAQKIIVIYRSEDWILQRGDPVEIERMKLQRLEINKIIAEGLEFQRSNGNQETVH